METTQDKGVDVNDVVSNLFLTQPLPSSKLYHVFKDNELQSLCGGYGMLFVNRDMADRIKGTETYKKGQDCKSCFKKAGLKT